MHLSDIRRASRAAGQHFFDRRTLTFFGSKVVPKTWTRADGITFFVTSEQMPDSDQPRLFTVRIFDPASGRVWTHGKFQQYRTQAEAFDAAQTASKRRTT